MTRQEVYNNCLQSLSTHTSLLLQLPTGYGKSKLSIDIINYLCDTVYKNKETTMLLLVAKRVHKQTWKEEFSKWGGIKVSNIIIECYESMHKHTQKSFDFLLMDEVHHVGSELRLASLKHITFSYMLGLSATIPFNLRQYFRFKYNADVIQCSISEAIEDAILPEPQILLLPLSLDNTRLSETIEVNAKAPGPIIQGEYKDRWKYKKSKQHAILKCTQRQKLIEMDDLISWEKSLYMRNHNEALKQSWLFHAGKRLEFLSDCKIAWVKLILQRLKDSRTITFCKTIAQTELLGSNCIHSKNKEAENLYNDFNAKKIDHITAVNILNENANLVDCKYAIFTNLSSSDRIMLQRTGRALRHSSPVIIIPYFKGTREHEIVSDLITEFDKEYIKTINSYTEI